MGAKCSGKELLCGGIQSVVRAWERSGLAGWLASRGRNEGQEWLPRKAQRPKPNSTATKAASSSRHRARAHPPSGQGRICRPTTIIAAAREQLAREPSRLPTASSPSSSILKIFHTIFPQFTKHPPLYAPTAVIPPAQIKTHRRHSYHRQNGRQKIRTRPAEGGR